MRVLIVGDEGWRDPDPIIGELLALPKRTTIAIDDEGRFGDLVEELATEQGLRVRGHNWSRKPLPDLVLAFSRDHTKGAVAPHLSEAAGLDIPVEVIVGDVRERFLSIKIPLSTGGLERVRSEIMEPLGRGGNQRYAEAVAMIGRGLELMMAEARAGKTSIRPSVVVR